MTDRFEDLRTFIAVVEAKSFNAAGERLRLAKSAVSRRVRELEDRLGTQLLNRTTRRISLTEAGLQFFERSTRILADLQEAEAAAADGAKQATGRLQISAPVSFTAHCLAPVLGEFLSQQPRLDVEIDTNDRIVDIVNEGFDLAIRISQLKDSTLIARRIAAIRHVACASPAYLKAHGRPKTPADLVRHRGVAYANVDGRHYWAFQDGVSVEAHCRLSIGNGDAIREAAVAGCGIVVLPTFIVHKAIMRGELEMVLLPYRRPPIAMHAVYASNRNVPAKTRAFVDFLLARFGETPFWDQELFGKKA